MTRLSDARVMSIRPAVKAGHDHILAVTTDSEAET